MMRTKVGLWIDNKNAIIVFVTGKKINKIVVKPGICQGTNNIINPEDAFPYYHDVMMTIRNAESILIYGNGKTEDLLKEQLERNNLGNRISCIETYDKLIIQQVAFKVQNYFQKKEVEA
jgi:hypothetical protein